MQMVFQDPWSSLNPRHSARRLIEEPLLLHAKLGAAERRARAEALAERVHLDRAMLDRLPSELSGGQLQRICVARAIATDPKLIVLDEPTSSLDLSVRAGILELLAEIRAATGAGMLFITHDLGTLKLISDEVVVLYLGSVMERAPTARIFEAPAHPYTQALISAHLSADPRHRPERIRLEGEIPSPISLPPGCPFASRCHAAIDACRAAKPELRPLPGGGQAACIRIDELNRGAGTRA
jgi:oligopeptide/dipeptide ABC transporter ATP-binding protein